MYSDARKPTQAGNVNASNKPIIPQFGLAMGYRTVAEAMRDTRLAAVISDMMHDEITPGLAAPEGFELDVYCADMLRRLRNPAIQHNLSQIAWDGSMKVPIRLLDTISENIEAGRSITALCNAVAAWMRFVRRAAVSNAQITDPIADELRVTGEKCDDVSETDVAHFLSLTRVFPDVLSSNAVFGRT